MIGSAIGENNRVTNIREQHIHLASPVEVAWPVEVGPVPALASAFQPRTELRKQVDAARMRDGAVVLTQVLAGGGGVGKSQLAASYATEALQKNSADLVLWTTASELHQVITQYALAAARLQVPGADGTDPEADARAFLEWLATTSRRWLLVLDDITAPEAIQPWWPASRTGTGWVLATTRLRDPRMTGGGRTAIPIDVYGADESRSFLRTRLTDNTMGHLLDDQLDALAEALGHLPLALSHAVAYMINEEFTCTEYLQLFTDRQTHLDDAMPAWADTEGYGRQITTTLLLSLDAARTVNPLVIPALRLTAVLDPTGHPYRLWATPSVLGYLGNHLAGLPGTAERTPQLTPGDTHTALSTLHRYALITRDTRIEARAVQMHTLTARAARETTPTADLAPLATTAATALLQAWPEPDLPHPDLAAALRASTDALADHCRDHLWAPRPHSILSRAGTSLLDARLATPAATYWYHLTADSERLLGPDHPDTLAARNNLAVAYQQAGRTNDAVVIEEQVLASSERVLGADHPHTLATRNALAISYRRTGRVDEATTLLEQVLSVREQTPGPNHPDTLAARNNLAIAYQQAGRSGEAIILLEQVAAGMEQTLGPDHPDTLIARSNLAVSYLQAGPSDGAITLLEQVAADMEQILGPDHPETLDARDNLATFHSRRGHTGITVDSARRALADRERIQGPDHPDTLIARSNLAVSYLQAGRSDEAVTLLEQVAADMEQILGPDHPDTLNARSLLAFSYRQSGHTADTIDVDQRGLADNERDHEPHHLDIPEAIPFLAQKLAEMERTLGVRHPQTHYARGTLAISYQEAGRTAEAIRLMRRVLADSERLFGPDDLSTLALRGTLATCYRQAGRTKKAIRLMRRVLADSERTLGPWDPSTVVARDALQKWREGRSI